MGYQKRDKADRHMKNTRAPWARVAQGAVLVSCLLVFLLGSALPAFAQLVREPYLQLATPTSITIVWRTNLTSANDSLVRYDTDGGPAWDFTATSIAGIPGSTPTVKDHIVTITGLTPATGSAPPLQCPS